MALRATNALHHANYAVPNWPNSAERENVSLETSQAVRSVVPAIEQGGIPIVTTIRALLLVNNLRGSLPFLPAANAKPGRSVCSKNALSAAGIEPSHSGKMITQ